jgi:hypothetical protein
MKSYIKLLWIIALSLTFVSCRSDRELKLSIEGWALYYAVEEFEETGYTALATQTTKLNIIPEWLIKDTIEIEESNYDYDYFEVIVYSNEGSTETYLIFIVYKEPLFLKHFFEENIISVEIERWKDV